LRAVSKLSHLKTFHSPQEAPNFSEWEVVKDKEGTERTPKWPDSLETFFISCSFDPGLIPAFEQTPASLRNLVIEKSDRVGVNMLEIVFEMIGSRILTLKLDYYERPTGRLANYFFRFPNLVHLSLRPLFVSEYTVHRKYQGIDHPLCSITINLDELDEVLDLEGLNDLLDERRFRLPNLTSLRLCISSSLDDWVPFARKNSVLLTNMGLFNIGQLLKLRSSSATCDFTESGV
jgi:hypothetical protein